MGLISSGVCTFPFSAKQTFQQQIYNNMSLANKKQGLRNTFKSWIFKDNKDISNKYNRLISYDFTTNMVDWVYSSYFHKYWKILHRKAWPSLTNPSKTKLTSLNSAIKQNYKSCKLCLFHVIFGIGYIHTYSQEFKFRNISSTYWYGIIWVLDLK